LKEEVKKIAVKQKNLGVCPPSAPERCTCEKAAVDATQKGSSANEGAGAAALRCG
jgi:hypothetical protein